MNTRGATGETGVASLSTIVVCVGIVTVDLVAALARPLEPRLKQRASSFVASPGGGAATAAAAVARMGHTARLVACVGEDGYAADIRRWLDAAGVEAHLIVREGEPSATSMVAVDPSGERTIINATMPGLVGSLDAHEHEVLVRAVEGADAVCADLRWIEGAQTALEFAASVGIPGVLDLDRSLPQEGARIQRLVRTASHVVASEPGLVDLCGTTDVDLALQELATMMHATPERDPGGEASLGPRVAGVTLGAGGVRWRYVGPEGDLAPRNSPAPVVETVETVGAGDVWHGVFAAELARRVAVDRAVTVASVAAALRCSQRGGWDALPSSRQVVAMLEESGLE
jgi:sulfofructose kinase